MNKKSVTTKQNIKEVKMNKKSVSLVCALVTIQVFAGDVWLKSSLTETTFSWRDKSSYVDDQLPQANDTVVVPAGMTAKLSWTKDDHADFDFVSTFRDLRVLDDAKVEVNVPTGEFATLGCAVSEYGYGTKINGALVKTGDGTLTLGAVAALKMADAIFMDYYVWLHVKAGTLRMPKTCSNDAAQLRYRRVTVDRGATLFTPDYGETYLFGGLSGMGLVTNECVAVDTSGAAKVRKIYFYSVSADADTSCFGGCMMGKMSIYAYSRFDLSGTDSGNTGSLVLNDESSVGIMLFGEKDGVVSSYGLGDLNFNNKSEARYIGEGETSRRSFWLGKDSTVDAGSGNLVFTGYWGNNGDTTSIRRLTVSGTNTVDEAVLSNRIMVTKGDYSSVIRKKGVGIWRLAHIANSDWAGLLSAEEGTLRFDTIAEAGEICSLGYSTHRLNDVIGGTAADNRVPYAIRIGGWAENGSPTEGLLEYTGTMPAVCQTRPIAIRSRGGIKASTAPIRLYGFTAEDAGEKTLVLDGDLDDENVAFNVTNGPGTVSIVKRGAGTWYLDGLRDFTGDVSVEAGVLIARQPTSKYSWYRFIVRETGFAHGKGLPVDVTDYERKGVYINELAFYGADGAELNLNTKYVTDWRRIAPGQMSFGRDDLNTADATGGTIEKLCDNTGTQWFGHVRATPTEEEESTHVPIVFRLPAGSAGAERFDFYYALANGANYSSRQPTSVRLEGSVDGVNWDSLFETNGIAYPASMSWISNGESGLYQPRKNKGFPIAPSNGVASLDATFSLGRARSVSVAKGATLKCEGGAAKIRKYVLDATGGGRLEGFAFDDTGVLEIRHLPRGAVEIPVDFTAAQDWDKMNRDGWTVETPGCTSRRYVKVTATGVSVSTDGCLIIVR